MTLVKMLETRDVAPDGVNVAVWEEGAEFEVTDPDLLHALIREGAAEALEPYEAKVSDETPAEEVPAEETTEGETPAEDAPTDEAKSTDAADENKKHDPATENKSKGRFGRKG